jgi:hypothetical protein
MMNAQNFWWQSMQPQRQTNISAEQKMQDDATLRNNKDAMVYMQNFLVHNPNPSPDQVQQVASQIKISPEYVIFTFNIFTNCQKINKMIIERQNSQTILTSLSPNFLTGEGAMQSLPMPPVYMFNNGSMRHVQLPPPLPQPTMSAPPQQVQVQKTAPTSAPNVVNPTFNTAPKQAAPKKAAPTEADKKLKPLLDEKQGISSADHVSQLLKNMGGEKTQKGRQSYIEAILKTTKPAVFKK